MSERLVLDMVAVPRLAPHMRLRFDAARQTWAIQAPERSFMLDEIAHAIVSRCDGAASVVAIIDDLSASFADVPREMIEKDVVALLQDLADKGVVAA
ncbi:MAG TPA: pyrroloquinoline quinone biosynthesis peptide chaperone PqqD [Rhizomicrobium sp.]|jgi:pyrroloquinoline quinone biosynthesis protein D